jgi:hypothetical protein
MKKILSGAVIAMVVLSACQKKVDAVDGSNATVTLTNAGANYVTENITVNPKDSIFFSFNISSGKDMKYVSIQKNPTNQISFLVRDTLTSANKNSYTAVKKFAADSINGDWVYRISAHDQGGNYIGHKDVIVSVKSDFTFWSYRFLQVPDSTAKTNKCYFATSNGKSYSYSDGAGISNLIDFGFFYDTTKVLAGTPATLKPKGYTIYTLPNTITPFLPYDISTWTKNATLLKVSGLTNLSTITSAGAIRTACIPALNSGTVTRYSQLDKSATASDLTATVFLFKTVTGKYGLMAVNFTNSNATTPSSPDSYINIDVKIEK